MLEMKERPAEASQDGNDELVHIFCACSEWLGLCGADITGDKYHGPYLGPETDDCVVCVDLVDQQCERCGE